MSWTTVIWSAGAGACVLMALMHFLVWCRDRRSWANLCFTVMVVGLLGTIVVEMVTMHTDSVAVYGAAFRWGHPAYAVAVAGCLSFVHFYFGTGKRSLLFLAIGLRGLVLVANFTTGLNLHVRSIESLQTIEFLGEPVSVLGEWVSNPWMLLGQAAALAQFVYLVDASLCLGRTGSYEARRRAAIVGGALILFSLVTPVMAALATTGVVRQPLMVSLPFLATLLAMSYELSGEMLRAVSLGRAVHERDLDLSLAVESAKLGFWVRDLRGDGISATDRWRAIFGFAPTDPLDFSALVQRLHPDDREMFRQIQSRSMTGDGRYDIEYRVVHPDGSERWVASRGRFEYDADGKPVIQRGVSADVTARKHAAQKLQQQREEVAHLSRVTTLGEISGSLAHELNQPLGAILANTEAAEMHLQRQSPDLEEVRKILADIRADDLRAGEIIHGMRDFLRRRDFERSPLDVAQLAVQAVKLISTDAASRMVTIGTEIPAELPLVMGDRIQLQQVLVNLLVNAMDAVATCPVSDRHVTLAARLRDVRTLEIAVTDAGVGIPPADVPRVFEPFRTTKPGGLGLGLPICRSILEGLGGTISIENNPDRGATVRVTLAACEP